MKILIATANAYKARELAGLLPDGINYLSLGDFPALEMPPETGKTLEENASLKAKTAAAQSGLWTLADDTGLEVDSLGGAPGVFSARYAGAERDYSANNAKLLAEMKKVPADGRSARFRCVMALSSPDGFVTLEEGRLEGDIAFAPKGDNGFGYDPLFIPSGQAKTLAEFSFSEKNAVSHRFAAAKKMAARLLRLRQTDG